MLNCYGNGQWSNYGRPIYCMGRFCLFVLLLYNPVNSFGHGGMVSLPSQLFLDKLKQAVHQYFVHILSLVNDSNFFE